ncbi:hypothetical protein GX50_05885 [[Emmonsia] crescens]|uniref:Uncharacterized protein n=1 Tax=[Emmonsia] crescens TaxID=73230 RepID=A0A2B7ZBK2_9EURO|nr:hypothetical protein GX50_05885 [Emmonsia crescens]
MASFLKNALRLRPDNLPTALPRLFDRGGPKTSRSRGLHGSVNPQVRIQTVLNESDLTHEQLEELFAGRFPADCVDEVIQLNNLSRRNFGKIVNAFDTSRNE